MIQSFFLLVFSLLALQLPVFPLSFPHQLSAQEASADKMEQLAKQIAEYESQVKSLQAKASTLSNQISQFDAQIKVAELKIQQTEDQISLLTGRIGTLNDSVNSLTKAFDARVIETYKLSRIGGDAVFIATAPSLRDTLSRYQYLTLLQQSDQSLLSRLKKANDGYQTQKVQLTQLNTQLEAAKKDLDIQKTSKARLLSVTQNDEKKYQALLVSARSEYDAIQAILSGKGDETEVGKVSEGSKIASVIGWNEWKNGQSSSSCNSSGAHLHFMVSKGGVTENPFSYLRSGIEAENCTGSGSCSAADPFNPSGSWSWPLNPKITYSQGYGRTWAVNNTWVGRVYQFHNGIDITSQSSSEVHAVKAGTLYRGSFGGTAGCRLRYVRVKHDDSDLSTFYLHINY